MENQKKNKPKAVEYLLLWTMGCFAYISLQGLSTLTITEIFFPLLICILIGYFLNNISKTKKRIQVLALFVFFIITIITFLGFTQTLSGTYVDERNPYLYGLSFYTASLAYHYKTKHDISLSDMFKISNPLLISTGPIALFIKSRRHNSVGRRVNYYLPFILVGIFFTIK